MRKRSVQSLIGQSFTSKRDLWEKLFLRITWNQFTQVNGSASTYDAKFTKLKSLTKSKALRELCDLGLQLPLYQTELRFAPWREL